MSNGKTHSEEREQKGKESKIGSVLVIGGGIDKVAEENNAGNFGERPTTTSGKIGSVLVVGGGISGMAAALDLADSGFKVYLCETSPGIGGIMAQLDKTFPTNDCAMCTISPRLVDVGSHRNIVILRNSELEKVDGSAGNFRTVIKRRPCYVIEEKCTGCGACAEYCPIDAIDEYNTALTWRRAAYIPYPQSVPKKYAIDREKCIGCGLCQQRCGAGAIDYRQKEEGIDLTVGAIVLATGVEAYNPTSLSQFGYGEFQNVVTSMEYERLLSSTGPFESTVLRLSDGQPPKNIAFLQCVGSRDEKTNPYCSSICCSAAIKQAIITKEHHMETRIRIFYMDIRTVAKGAEEYFVRAKRKYGIEFVRSRVAQVLEDPKTKNLLLRYVDERGEPVAEDFDLVVLSVGLTPPSSVMRLSDRLGLKLGDGKFFNSKAFAPLESGIDGIYLGGAATEPKDIPDAVAQGGGAAARCASLIHEARGTQVTEKVYPPEKDVSGLEPRIGVFICHCGTNIGAVVNVPEIVEYAKKLPNVVYAERNLYTCSTDTQTRIKEMVEKHNLNRVIVASCTPRTHEPLFQNTIREAGLNPYLFEMANIRDQCSWVHTREPAKATQKAKDLLRMSVARAALIRPLYMKQLKMERKSALIIGGGIAGMTAALDIADQDFEVDIVEKTDSLGGMLRNVHYTLDGDAVQKQLHEVMDKVKKHENIKLHFNSEVIDKGGTFGNYVMTVQTPEGKVQLKCATVIVAVGAQEYRPSEYMYGRHNIITQSELERRVAAKDMKAKDIVMIQCVGSREEPRLYCSRVCCTEAVKNALRIKKEHPDTNVWILYRDIRTYGLAELKYREASEKGVKFVMYDVDRKPVVAEKGSSFGVRVFDSVLKEEVEIASDMVVLSSAIVPNPVKQLAETLKIPLDENGFFLEAHMKLKPVATSSEGIFLCGTAQAPKSIRESISQGSAVAAKAGVILARGVVEAGGPVAQIDKDKCSSCLTCVRTCPFSAPFLGLTGVAEIDEAKCQGCGSCVAACPAKAIQLLHYTDPQTLEKCAALFAVEAG